MGEIKMNDNTSNDLVEKILTAWRARFPNNMYAWPGAPTEFAIEAACILRAQLAAAEAENAEIKNGDLLKKWADWKVRALAAEARLEIAREALEENEEYWKVAHDLIENARETVRLKIVYDKRPPGLFQDLQNAVYICRGRNVEALRSLHPDGGKK